jgi:hypothetical protein
MRARRPLARLVARYLLIGFLLTPLQCRGALWRNPAIGCHIWGRRIGVSIQGRNTMGS